MLGDVKLIDVYDNKNEKIKILEKLFSENKTCPLLKTPEKDFQLCCGELM